MDKEKKVSKLAMEFNISSEKAREMLIAKCWDYDEAYGVAKFCTYSSNPTGVSKNFDKSVENCQKRSVVGGGTSCTTSLINSNDAAPSENRQLKRGISRTSENEFIVNKVQENVQKDYAIFQLKEMPIYTFMIPDLSCFPEDFRAFLQKQLIETSTLVTLEQAGRLNWWADTGACQRLMPLATIGDGNCLLHAASLGMWGFQDRKLMLRKAVYKILNSTTKNESLYRRWRWQQTVNNKASGLIYEESEWDKEWENLLKLASAIPRIQNGQSNRPNDSNQISSANNSLDRRAVDEDVYESLEEFHVFVLAHVLKRPIIVVADTVLKDSKGDALAPIPFGGIYLPLEVKEDSCYKSPLLLTYDSSHFSALLAINDAFNDAESGFYSTGQSSNASVTSSDEKPPAVIPIIDPEFRLLPVHFTIDPGPNFNWNKDFNETIKSKLMFTDEKNLELIGKYLDIIAVPLPKSSSVNGDSSATRSDSDSIDFEDMQTISQMPTGIIVNDIADASSNQPKEMKEKEKIKVSNKMQKVAKSFGKKIKKGFGNLGKTKNKTDVNFTGIANNKRSSIGSVTQTTRMQLATLKMLNEKDSILSAKLNIKKVDHYDKMIENYISEKKEVFKLERKNFKQREIELKGRISKYQQDSTDSVNANKELSKGKCINGCNKPVYNTYLCADCFEKQKADLLNIEQQSHPNSPSIAKKVSNSVNCLNHDSTQNFVTMPESQLSSTSKNVINIPIKIESLSLSNSNKSYGKPISCVQPLVCHEVDAKKFNSLPPIYRAKYLNNCHENDLTYSKSDDFEPFIDDTDIIPKNVNASTNINPNPFSKPFPTTNTRDQQQYRCENSKCKYYGSPVNENLCSTCYKQFKPHGQFKNIQF